MATEEHDHIGRFRAYLAERGLKVTRQREVICQVFFASGEHLSLEDVLQLAQAELPSIGYATVYRTMKLLADSGLASEHRFGQDQTRYEPAFDGEHHDHLVCSSCGSIVEFEDELIERRQEAIARSHGFTIRSHRHVIHGLCARCSSREG
jgi:Fur family ferric uptake transcriptional regulator